MIFLRLGTEKDFLLGGNYHVNTDKETIHLLNNTANYSAKAPQTETADRPAPGHRPRSGIALIEGGLRVVESGDKVRNRRHC